MVDTRVRRRDRNSLEIKFRHLHDEGETSQAARRTRVRTRLYFFLPYSFNIRPDTFDEHRFYEDIKLYIRFDTPRLTTATLLDEESGLSPLNRIRDLQSRPESRTGRLVYELRLLGAVYKSLLRDATRRLRGAPAESRRAALKECCAELEALAGGCERLRKLFRDVPPDGPRGRAFALVDEYLSLALIYYGTNAVHEIRREGARETSCLEALVRDAREYIGRRGYPSGAAGHGRASLEEYVYRHRVLKRYCVSALFLAIRRKNQSARVEHLLYAVAAGIAMAVATAVSFLSQIRLGGISTALFLVLVGSYMIKDRIKDLMRAGFQRSLGRLFYDRRTVFSDPHEKVQLGVIKERVLFVTHRLDPNVEAVRARGRFEREALGSFPEEVLEYEKLFSLNNSRLRSVHTRIRGVADVSILDVRRFLQYLTRQRELVGLPDGKAGIKVAPVKRIYHLNLVIRCTADGEDLFRKIRLIVGPEGIRRVEPVNSG